jgi:TolB protein
MNHCFRFFFFSLFICLVFLAPPAHAVLKVDVTHGQANPMPVAITEFTGDRGMGADIAEVVTHDLESSGLFRAIDPGSFIQHIESEETLPRFADWRQISAQGLVTGSIAEAQGGKIKVAFRLWDVLSERQFAGKSYMTEKKNWRRIAHMISDEIYMRLTGEGAYFDSRIVYIAEEDAGRGLKKKRLAMMDQDGANHIYLSSGKDLVLTPRFDPTSQKIIYLAYHARVPSVYLYDIETGREEMVGSFKGMSFAPRFSPDGRKAIMSVSLDGNSEIYELDLGTKEKKRLTNHPAIDTSPCYSPDGSRIVFNSDRGGSQQLYIMNRDGSGVKRISFGKGNYGTPVWSPRGDFVAFTKMYQGDFHIGVMRSDGSGERLLTTSFMDEGPTWSPNGRIILFGRQTQGSSSRQGEGSLVSIDLTGYNERTIKTPIEASDPAWSPLLSKK